MKSMKWNLDIGLLYSIALLGSINLLDFLRRPACFGCGFPRGAPFAL